MGVQSGFHNIGRALAKASASHPHAHGSVGFWVVQRPPEPPLGWVITIDAGNAWEFTAYAYCWDTSNKRPWLKMFSSLNAAVAWMLQHEAEIRALIASSAPEPRG
jgi:hypothetical protein